MKLVDLNLLLYSTNRDSPFHERARDWVEAAFSSGEAIVIPWLVLLGYLRLSTNPRVFPEPLSVEAAVDVVDGWLSMPSLLPLDPGPRHWAILRDLLVEAGTGGNLTGDAHLAALAIEHDAELCSTDADFGRFRSLRWVNPLAG